MPATDFPRVALLVETSTMWARSILEGVNRYLRKSNYWQVFLEPHSANEIIRPPAGWEGEGVIADIKHPVMAEEIRSLGIPVVNVSPVTFPDFAFPTVTTDHDACARMVAEYYFERGYANFGYLHLDGNDFDAGVMGEFCKCVRQGGGEFFSINVKDRMWGVADWNLNIQALAGWLEQLPKPVGLFSWAIGREVVHACHLARLRMPEEVALVMTSDDEVFLEISHIPMSGIIHPGAEIGHQAARMLDGLMARGKKKKPLRKVPRELIPPPGIKTRQSSDVMAIADPVLRAAIAYARQHAGEPVQVSDMAAHAGISRRALEQRFAKTLERSPADYIRDMHLTRAKDLLRETTLPIPQVADASGFASPEYMARFFRSRLGVSPLRYRKKITAR
ncbi:helix-turn-helix domain-containing protein [Opitutaceae bacterium TAV4]|nr:helix-turn-helix domain-containing protein [Opitutaceae bacterium TAV4]RRJ98885.1 helix-turn-helix domain-containing protein [Opitutaceae bacterium TAV3]